ncbi:hypothetical protein AWR27_18100 [Spirosoma montaniterrae]|uniref:Uncharacterized protein n=1 Tax=Spirosoma montaniterrae TaxID=1178516 RepID=A0A1P9X0F1_9BACT|nr:hypothetical protein AWR27_18100 [Spirosoma montaniterrae]
MHISRKRFVGIFLLSAFAFQFISNSLLGPEVGLFPKNGEWFLGAESPIAWQRTLATIIYPFKFVLIKPLSFLAQDPDPAPPMLVAAFSIYWAAIALVLHFLLSLTNRRRNE